MDKEERTKYGKKHYSENKHEYIERARLWRVNNIEHRKIYESKYNEIIRNKVLDYYGSKCNCCGENNRKFLAIDHINNDGAAHKRLVKVSSGRAMYTWIIKNNFPSTFQTLCHNCNVGKKNNKGICPHKTLLNKNEKEN